MPKEIERKFLVTQQDFKKDAEKIHIVQAYLSRAKNRTVRVRIADDQAFLTVKGKSKGLARREYEYKIPREEAEEMIKFLAKKHHVEKYRYLVNYQGFTWEVDEFLDINEGLVLAEIELKEPDQSFPKPPWLGKEVTDDPRFFNASLSKTPFQNW